MSDWIEYMTSDNVSPMADLRRSNGREKPWKLKYFGIGNESWGCGGNMRPEYYADLYRHYQTYCRNYSGNDLYKVACGPSGDDYNWTDKLLEIVKPCHTKAISLHYYTVPSGKWEKKGSATEFDSGEYEETIRKTYYMEELITKHSEIMSRHDPKHEIGLIVDEWGTWYDVEPGTNPGFLYQQNTMRDAIVASVNLNIFNNHSDRVVMANIAQCVNVLQSVILTEGERMIKTPTYHVFDMYKEHQGAMLADSFIDDKSGLPDISQSVSVKDGKMHITISNASLTEEKEINAEISGFDFNKVSAEILTEDVHAHNTFDIPNKVEAKTFTDVKMSENTLKFTLPTCSVVAIEIKK